MAGPRRCGSSRSCRRTCASCSPRESARPWRPPRPRHSSRDPGGGQLRTLVLSDLHFGAHSGADVLRDPGRRALLIEQLAGCDRLVLLGDLLELRHGPLAEALAAARAPLAEIGSALGSDGEVVILAGNHDHHLVAPWTWRRDLDGPAPALGLDTAVDWSAGEPLAA
ncbi:MAG: metallophosphoesterase, partial [Solirubrobacteraceae bacterium]